MAEQCRGSVLIRFLQVSPEESVVIEQVMTLDALPQQQKWQQDIMQVADTMDIIKKLYKIPNEQPRGDSGKL